MKRFTTYNLGFALQIFAVIMLFGYPGCSSIKGREELSTDKKGLRTEKKLPAEAGTAKIKKAGDSLNLLQPWEQDVTKFFLVAWPRK